MGVVQSFRVLLEIARPNHLHEHVSSESLQVRALGAPASDALLLLFTLRWLGLCRRRVRGVD